MQQPLMPAGHWPAVKCACNGQRHPCVPLHQLIHHGKPPIPVASLLALPCDLGAAPPGTSVKVFALDAAQPFDFEHKMQHKVSKDKQLTIGIVGFGTFGQFLARRMVEAGHRCVGLLALGVSCSAGTHTLKQQAGASSARIALAEDLQWGLRSACVAVSGLQRMLRLFGPGKPA